MNDKCGRGGKARQDIPVGLKSEKMVSYPSLEAGRERSVWFALSFPLAGGPHSLMAHKASFSQGQKRGESTKTTMISLERERREREKNPPNSLRAQNGWAS